MSEKETIDQLTEEIEKTKDLTVRYDLLFRRGRLKWKKEDRAGAMNDYSEACAINPDGPASVALDQARRIMNFYNKDLYNP